MVAAIALLAALAQDARQASALLDAGIELSHRGQFHEAAEKFVQALALDPRLAEAHYLLGLVRQQEGRAEAALRSFRSALAIEPRNARAQARICELLTSVARARETGYHEAKSACRRAALLDPKDPEPRFHLGWIESKLGNPAGAAREYQIVLHLDPRFPGVKFELAMAYLDSQGPERAVPLLEEVITAEPAHPAARFQLGVALAKKGHCERAVPLLEAAAESAQKHYVLAGCLKTMGRAGEAATELAKVKQLREGAEARMQARFRAAMAQRNVEAGKLDEAIADYRASLALVRDPSVVVDLAVALLKKDRPGEVVGLLSGEAGPLAQYQIALAYSRLERWAEARAALDSALGAHGEFVEAWYQLGVVSLALGKPEDAEQAFRTAVRLRPDEAALRLAWAEALRRLGRLQQAEEQRRLAGKLPK